METKTNEPPLNSQLNIFDFTKMSRQVQTIYFFNILKIFLATFFITFNLVYITNPEELNLKIVRLTLAILVALTCITLLRLGKIRVSAMLTCLGTFAVVMFYPVFVKLNIMEIYISNSFILLGYCITPCFVFKISKDSKLIVFICTLLLLINLTSDHLMIHRYGEAGDTFVEFYKNKQLFLTLGKISIGSFLVANCMHIVALNEKHEMLTNKAREQLKATNENLENLIRERTRSLEEQNKRLLEYTYINSHMLRGPVARLKGLMLLLEIDKSESNIQFCHSSIEHCLGELDSVIYKINKILNEEDQAEVNAIQEKVRKMYSGIPVDNH